MVEIKGLPEQRLKEIKLEKMSLLADIQDVEITAVSNKYAQFDNIYGLKLQGLTVK